MGEIFKLGLLKNNKGEPYKHKASLLKIILSMPHGKKKTPWGVGYIVSEKEIKKFNKKHINS